MAFFQEPPRLGNQFDGDPMLASWIARFCPEVADELRALGDLTVEYYGKQLADRHHEPVLTQWDAWGHRIDHIEVSPLWKHAAVLSAERGLVAADLAGRVLETMSPDDRLVLTMIDGEDAPVKEVAEATGWSESNVKVKAFRARRRMREALEKLLG
jgi:hypothetical protein